MMNTGLNDELQPEIGITNPEMGMNSELNTDLNTESETEIKTENEEFTEIPNTPLKIPSKIYNKLFPHQKTGIPWLHNTLHNGPYQGGILADDMGCGKSALVATYLLSLFTSQHLQNSAKLPKILIVSPNSITDNWRIELRNWAPSITVYDCSSRVNIQTRLNNILDCFAFGGICVTNYENVAGRTKFDPETGDNFLQYKWVNKDHATTVQKEILRAKIINPGQEIPPTEISRQLENGQTSTFDLDLQKGLEWDYLILDEAHQIRNVNNRSNRVKQINATYRLAMTGTPIQNRMSDYFNILDWVTHSTMFSTKKEFEENYGKPIETAREKGERSNREFQRAVKKGQQAAEKLKDLVDPIKLQRSKFELNLMNGVKKTDIVVHCYTSDYQQELYKRVLNDENLQDIIDEGTKRCMLTYLTHLKAICDSPVLSKIAYKEGNDSNNNNNNTKNGLKREFFGSPSFDSPSPAKSGKSENSTDIYTDLPSISSTNSTSNTLKIADSGKLEFITHLLKLQIQEETLYNVSSKTLIFSRSKKILSIIQKYLEEELGYQKDRDFMRLDGDVRPAHRQNIINGFNSIESVKVMLLTTQVGREGLTLTSANKVVIYDPSWNPAEDAQAVDRAYRIGQKRHVVVYRLITCGTVEEKMYRRQIYKSGIIKTSLDRSDNDSRRYFSSTDLQELFELTDFDKSETCEKLVELHGGGLEPGSPEWLVEHVERVRNMVGIGGKKLVYGLNFVSRMFTVENDDVDEMLAGDVADELIKDEFMRLGTKIESKIENYNDEIVFLGETQKQRKVDAVIDLTNDDEEKQEFERVLESVSMNNQKPQSKNYFHQNPPNYPNFDGNFQNPSFQNPNFQNLNFQNQNFQNLNQNQQFYTQNSLPPVPFPQPTNVLQPQQQYLYTHQQSNFQPNNEQYQPYSQNSQNNSFQQNTENTYLVQPYGVAVQQVSEKIKADEQYFASNKIPTPPQTSTPEVQEVNSIQVPEKSTEDMSLGSFFMDNLFEDTPETNFVPVSRPFDTAQFQTDVNQNESVNTVVNTAVNTAVNQTTLKSDFFDDFMNENFGSQN